MFGFDGFLSPREKEQHLLDALKTFHHRHMVESSFLVNPVDYVDKLGDRTVVEVGESERAECKVVPFSLNHLRLVRELQPVRIAEAAGRTCVVLEVQHIFLRMDLAQRIGCDEQQNKEQHTGQYKSASMFLEIVACFFAKKSRTFSLWNILTPHRAFAAKHLEHISHHDVIFAVFYPQQSKLSLRIR